MLEINIKATFLIAQQFYVLMKGVKNPNILIISSIAGYKIDKEIGLYSVTKTALFGLTKLLAKEL